MIVVGYERTLNDEPYHEFVEVSRHETKEDAELAMEELKTAQAENADVLLFFYGIATSESEYKVNLVIDPE
jgi:hypothetical protein